MIVALMRIQVDYSALLQQVPVDESSGDLTRAAELDSNELAESRRVVVAHRLGIAKGFQNGIRTKNLLGQVRELSANGLGTRSV